MPTDRKNWDGDFWRSVTPDFINIGGGFTGIVGVGSGTSIEANWVLNEKYASLVPVITISQTVGGGFSLDGTINVGAAYYSGNAADITTNMLVTNTPGGDSPTKWGSVGAVAGPKIDLTGSYTPLSNGETIQGAQVNFGAGIPVGEFPINVAGGVSNTWKLRN